MAADRAQLAVSVHRDFDIPMLLALVIGGSEGFAAILHPFDGLTDETGRGWYDDLFRVEWVLRSEAAADIGRDDTHLMFGQAEHLDKNALGLVRHLGGIPDGEIVAQLEARHDAACFDRMTAAFVHAKTIGETMRGVSERTVDVAVFHRPLGHEIVRT